MLFLYNNA